MNERANLLAYDEVGDGPPVVFLHGMGGTRRYWRGRIDPLADRYRLICMDLLGFGESPKNAERYGVAEHVGAIEATLDRLGLDRFVLIGHSMGAILATALAARSPQRLRGLGLISLPCFGDQEDFVRQVPPSQRWLFRNLAFAAIACVISRRILGPLMPRLLPELPEDVCRDMVEHTWKSFTSSLREVIYNFDVIAASRRLPDSLPVLLIHGQEDKTAPLDHLDAVLRIHPPWELHVYPGVDHHPLLHATDRVLSDLRSWLDSVEHGANVEIQ